MLCLIANPLKFALSLVTDERQNKKTISDTKQFSLTIYAIKQTNHKIHIIFISAKIYVKSK